VHCCQQADVSNRHGEADKLKGKDVDECKTQNALADSTATSSRRRSVRLLGDKKNGDVGVGEGDNEIGVQKAQKPTPSIVENDENNNTHIMMDASATEEHDEPGTEPAAMDYLTQSASISGCKRPLVEEMQTPMRKHKAAFRGKGTPRELSVDLSSEVHHNMVQTPFDPSKFTLGLSVHDTPSKGNILAVPEYVADIYQRLYVEEVRASVNIRYNRSVSACTHTIFVLQDSVRPWPYMHKQPNLSPTMRAILVDWLVEVHMKFRLVPEVLYLSVNIIDRYLQTVEVQRSKLQLVGVTALLIASKYEEIYPPEVRDCVYITNRAYTRQEVIDMEANILKVINFKLSSPTAHPFLLRFLFITKASPNVSYAAAYYLERVLQEHDLLKYRPSHLAAAAVYLALKYPSLYETEHLKKDMPNKVSDDYLCTCILRCANQMLTHTTTTSLASPPLSYTFPLLLLYSMHLSALSFVQISILLNYTNYSEDSIIKCAKVISSKVAEEVVTVSKRELIAVKRKYSDKRYNCVAMLFGNPDDDLIL
jgi:Cyclin, N-terminal domain/Cyclin, C-terminal domain